MQRVWQRSRLGSRAERADGRQRSYRRSVRGAVNHMSSGDVMKSKIWANRVLQSREWVLGSAVALLLISAGGLALLAQHAREQANVATLLLAIYLGFWSYVLGLIGLFLTLAWWLVSRRRLRVTRSAMSRYAPAEPRRRHLATPEPEHSHFLQQEVAPVASSRSSMEVEDKDQSNSRTRVA
jgi:hypothetical protein